jgi:hypothetical protein
MAEVLKVLMPSDGALHALNTFLHMFVKTAITKTIGAPFEMAKKIKQDSFTGGLFMQQGSPYAGLSSYEVLCTLYKNEGLNGLFAGNITNIVRVFPTQMTSFYCKDYVKSLLPKFDKKKNPGKVLLVNLAAGGAVGGAALAVVYPLDLARERLQLSAAGALRDSKGFLCKYRNLGEVIASVLLQQPEQGLLSLYSGLGTAIIGIIPFRAAYFGINDALRDLNPFQKRSDWKGVLSKFMTAQLAGIAAAVVSQPFDVVRRGQQRYLGKGFWEVFIEIVRVGGWQALFYGCGLNVIHKLSSAGALVLHGKIIATMKRPPPALK